MGSALGPLKVGLGQYIRLTLLGRGQDPIISTRIIEA
ncbi:uncharacterized protein G2W53_031614 [Senna tora]|uniref:Uncharacterized protein n=1 Tax=Senna tora TaxID=362788 RepID=A0A834TA70_9FABA|nr:uncharacterized protein G2W53_031614 [Senna tora]